MSYIQNKCIVPYCNNVGRSKGIKSGKRYYDTRCEKHRYRDKVKLIKKVIYEIL